VLTHLVLSLVGADRTGLVDRLSEVIVRWGGNLEESRMAVLGGEFAAIMLVSVNTEKRAALEKDIQGLAHTLGLMALCKETAGPQPHGAGGAGVAFDVNVSGMDHEGIVHEVVHYLAGQGMSIDNLESHITQAPYSGTALFSMSLAGRAPSAVSVGDVRSRLHDIADSLNVDIRVQFETAKSVH